MPHRPRRGDPGNCIIFHQSFRQACESCNADEPVSLSVCQLEVETEVSLLAASPPGALGREGQAEVGGSREGGLKDPIALAPGPGRPGAALRGWGLVPAREVAVLQGRGAWGS